MSDSCCDQEKCGDSSGESECCETKADNCCNFAEHLLEIADEAWCELLKEKIKKEIQASCGEKLDQLAKLVAQANGQKWAHKMKGKALCEEYKNNLKKMFSSCECKE